MEIEIDSKLCGLKKNNTLDSQWQWLLHTSVDNLQSLAAD